MPRKFTRSRPARPLPKGTPGRIYRITAEIREMQKETTKPEGEKPGSFKDMFIGRPLVNHLAELPEDARRILAREQAAYHPEGAGLVYIKSLQMQRFAARSVLSRAIVADQLDRLRPSGQSRLGINRGEVWLQPLPLRTPTVQSFHVMAPVIRTYKNGEETQLPRLERAQLEHFFGLHETVRSSEVWLGYLNLPLDSGAEQDVAYALDEALPDAFAVDGVQLYARQPKQ